MDEERNKIENLKKALYSRTSNLPQTLNVDLEEHGAEIEKNWPATEVIRKVPKPPKERTPISVILLMCASAFFVVSILFAGYIYFKGENVISGKNISVFVSGPQTVAAGETVTLDIAITNSNDTPLILADLLVEYPKGTRSASDKATELPRERIPIGTVEPHQTVRRTISALLFAEEGQKPMVKYSLEYRLENSGSNFSHDGEYELSIGSSPITLNVDMLKEVTADQELIINVTVNSNSSDTVQDLLLKAEFPTGFEMKSSSPESVAKKTVWSLGDIEPNGERKIKIRGTVTGGASEEKTFKFSIGGKDKDSDTVIDTPFINLAKSLTIKESFIGLSLFVDGGLQGNQLSKSGTIVQSRINYKNNLSVPVTDAVVEVKLTGKMIDKKSVDASPGFYRSSSDLLRWTKFESDKLESIAPNKDGDLLFNFELFDAFGDEAKGLKNQEVLADITLKGKRLSEDNVPETLESTIKRRIKIETVARFNAEAKHFSGPFTNEGPYPLKVDKKTDFTITWTVNNSLNDLDGAVIKATLPSYVVWSGKTNPTSEKVIYDPDSRQITWVIGKVFSGGGTTGSLRQLSFQVSMTPSLSQVRTAPALINVAQFEARDTFTGTTISINQKPLNTAVFSEDGYDLGNEYVEE